MTILENKMGKFIDGLREAGAHHNYYAAIAMALTLPDICSKLQYPEERNTGTRYKNWYDQYMLKKYQHEVGADRQLHTFLSGNDFYALRCAYLHHGESEVTDQRAREVLNHFVFLKPQLMSAIHLNQSDDKLQLQVDIFCVDVLLSVEEWVQDYKEDEGINQRAQNLFEIHSDFSF